MRVVAASLDAALGRGALARVVELGADRVGASLATEVLELPAGLGAVFFGLGRRRCGGGRLAGSGCEGEDDEEPHAATRTG